ncbi:MAG: hypothetical protein ABIO43_09515, partial [Sphingomicrobium sp.]
YALHHVRVGCVIRTFEHRAFLNCFDSEWNAIAKCGTTVKRLVGVGASLDEIVAGRGRHEVEMLGRLL